MGDSSASYIHKVQHLIEECILFNMGREECMEALSKHAGIQPLVTSTVWKELEKENREFFEAYARQRTEATTTTTTTTTASTDSHDRMETTRQRIRKILSDSSGVNYN